MAHVLGIMLAWPPTAIGGPIASAELLTSLARRGHKVTVLSRFEKRKQDDEPIRVADGINILPLRGWRYSLTHYVSGVDVVYTHPDLTGSDGRPIGREIARRIGVPVVYALHNMQRATHVLARQFPPALYVWNSESTRKFMGSTDVSGIVVRPRLVVKEHAWPDRSCADSVTLVNTSADKGAAVLNELAKRMPGVKFIGVRGGYGSQLGDPELGVNIQGPFLRSDMPEEVWSRTKVLIMPSKHEAWGMAALEAMCSGIPVIASTAPGLAEALGGAGVLVGDDDIDGWEHEVSRLMGDKKKYDAASKAAVARAREVEQLSAADTELFSDSVINVIGAPPPTKNDPSARQWRPDGD
jgi:glycosyltransferase involved in cell wall biosynthesis